MDHPKDLSQVSAVDMAVLQKLIPSDWPDGWRDFAAVFFAGLIDADLSVSREALARAAMAQVLTMSVQLGGQTIYLPRGHRLSAVKVAEQVRREFNGCIHRELAARHGLSDVRVRQILKAAA